jgi:hypothetical protein
MTNLPNPEPRSSRLGFDELVAIVVAFTVIGTIFFVSLRPKDKALNLSLTPNPTVSTKTPAGLSNQNSDNQQSLPAPQASEPGNVVQQPTTPATPEKVLGNTPLLAVPPVAVSPQVENVPFTPVKKVNFKDVPQVFWARPYIEALAERGVINGFPDGTFRPNQPVTRAEFAAQLQKAFEHKVVVDAPKFKDVPSKFWASAAIQETSRSGFLRGYPGNIFQPNQQIPKVQALVALDKGLGLTSTTDPKKVLKVYQDAASIPKYATKIVASATEAGLVVNYPNRQRLEPNKPLTRGEAAALIYQGMVKASKASPITSDYVVKP